MALPATPGDGARLDVLAVSGQQQPVSLIDRSDVLDTLVSMYAAALEYPPEVFTPDTELEAELGVDSVKQTELLARVGDTYALPPLPAGFRIADHGTLGR
ncbi:hypothetical protein G9H71_18375, partial [Motilibacter sp. E257]|nr:hypothetical protein [Motilibacter deserti]